MLKKIIILTLLLNTLLSAQTKEKSFLVGVDIKYTKIDTVYETSGEFAYPRFVDGATQNIPAIKLGYQYYFTRIYLQYSKINENYEFYSIRSKFFDLNFEYIPVIYERSNYKVRGIFGVSIGLNYTRMYDLKRELLNQHKVALLEDYRQNHPMYGFQLGAVYELDFGLSVDLGLRIRKGDFTQMKEETQEMAIRTDRKEYYLGFNYLF